MYFIIDLRREKPGKASVNALQLLFPLDIILGLFNNYC